MRALAGWIVVLALVASPAMAGTGGAGDGSSAAANANNAPAAKENTAGTSAAPATAATPAKPATPAQPAPASLDNQVQQLRDLVEAQTRQLQTQNELLKAQQKKMLEMESQLNTVDANVASMGLTNEGADPALASNPATIGALGYYDGQERKDEPPTAIHIKGITITPGGFFAAETVTRQRALSDDVNTHFNGIPMPGSSQAKVPETNFSGRQSQITTMIQGKLDTVTLRGYLEADFLSAGVTSNNNESNSYTFRQRQLWAQAAMDSGWTFTGGQMWSLVTETKKLLAPLSEAKPTTIDAQYTVGFSWARQYGFRITKNIGDRFAVGFSVEAPQATFTAHGFAITQSTTHAAAGAAGPLSPTLVSAVSNGNALVGAAGDLSGLYNNQANYSFNPAPDFVFKAAWEPGWGHYEVFGLISEFRTRIFPCASAANLALGPCPNSPTPTAVSAFGASNDQRTGGGFGANAHAPFFNHHLDVGLHALVGSGVGRYGTSGLPDATLRGDGTFALLRSVQALGSLEFHATPKLDIYGYGGGEYVGRGQYPSVTGVANSTGYGLITASNAGCGIETLPNGANTALTSVNIPGGTAVSTGVSPTAYNGYQPGALGSCTADTRVLLEGTLGFWYRFYQGPKGRLQAGVQYSYVTRNAWGATAGGSPHGIENMGFTSFRYYLP